MASRLGWTIVGRGVPAAVLVGAALVAAWAGVSPRSGPAPGEIEYWGEPGRGSGQMYQPRSIAITESFYFIADRTGRILRYRKDFTYDGCWRMPQTASGFPAAIEADPDGTLLVGDTHYGRIVRYSPAGEELASFGRVGSGPGEFQRIQGLMVDPDRGDIYACDYLEGTDRIQVFTHDGIYLRAWGCYGSEPGQFNRPTGVALDSGGRVVVADAVNARLQVFTRQGELLAVWAEPDLSYPFDVDTDAAGNVYTVELTGSRVIRFDPEGRVTGILGRPGGGEGELAQPWGLEVEPDGLVHVADTRNHRMARLRFP